MSYRLCNEQNQTSTLTLNNRAWYQILSLAEQNGWNPMGTIQPEWLAGVAAYIGGIQPPLVDTSPGSYTPEVSRKVLLDDALNLADALERAFLYYEHQPISSSNAGFRTEWDDWFQNGSQPAVGVVVVMMEFCREGAFWVEKFA